MREDESIEALPDFAEVVAFAVEFEETGGLATRVDKNVALRIGGDADAFSEIQIRRHADRIRYRLVWNLGSVSRFGSRGQRGRRQIFGLRVTHNGGHWEKRANYQFIQ